MARLALIATVLKEGSQPVDAEATTVDWSSRRNPHWQVSGMAVATGKTRTPSALLIAESVRTRHSGSGAAPERPVAAGDGCAGFTTALPGDTREFVPTCVTAATSSGTALIRSGPPNRNRAIIASRPKHDRATRCLSGPRRRADCVDR